MVAAMDSTADAERAASGTQWTITSGLQEAVVVEVGGGVRTYRVAGADVVDGFAEDELCVGSAGQVLAPWPNRVRDGQYAFGGHSRQLPLSEPEHHNAIHGLVNWVRWQPVQPTGADSLTLEHALVPQPGFPWPLRLRTTWSVGGGGLRAEHAVTNTGSQVCPFGLAAHPYVLVPGVAIDDLVLTVPARSRLLTDSRLLPIGAARVAGGEFDFGTGRRLGAAVLDTSFGELDPLGDGGSQVTLTASDGRAVVIWADAAFSWWQVYSADTLAPPRRRRSIAVEPMTCPPDALRSGRDLVSLEPGQTWHGSWGIRAGVGPL